MKNSPIHKVEKAFSFFSKSTLITALALWLWAGMGQASQAQQILWEKYWPNLRGQFDCVVEGDSGNLFGVGYMWKIIRFGTGSANQDTLEGVFVVKMKPNGDSVWCKKIADNPGGNSDKYFLKNNGNGSLTLVHHTGNQLIEISLKIRLVSQLTGASFLAATIPNVYWEPVSYHTDLFGNIYALGEKYNISSNRFEMVCLKIPPSGNMEYEKTYNPGNNPNCKAQYIEPMPGGRMRLSGNKGKTIVSYELDSLGNASNYKEYIDNPFNYVQQNGAYVQQADSGYFLVSVDLWSTNGSTIKSLVRKVKANGDVVWGGGKNFAGDLPIPTLDGGYIRTRGLNGQTYYERYLGDSTINWSINTTNTTTIGNKQSLGLLFFPDQSGIGYGVVLVAGNGPQPNLVKFGNVGQPVDPSNPVPAVLSTEKPQKKAEIGYAFPNPTTGVFHLLGMGSGQFRLSDSQGRILLQGQHKGGDGIDVSHLPCGIYHYSLVTPLSKTEGRIVRE